jgi:hypothetical protein
MLFQQSSYAPRLSISLVIRSRSLAILTSAPTRYSPPPVRNFALACHWLPHPRRSCAELASRRSRTGDGGARTRSEEKPRRRVWRRRGARGSGVGRPGGAANGREEGAAASAVVVESSYGGGTVG